jgi:hypothetical protein
MKAYLALGLFVCQSLWDPPLHPFSSVLSDSPFLSFPPIFLSNFSQASLALSPSSPTAQGGKRQRTFVSTLSTLRIMWLSLYLPWFLFPSTHCHFIRFFLLSLSFSSLPPPPTHPTSPLVPLRLSYSFPRVCT